MLQTDIVKKILGLVLTLFVVFSFVGVTGVDAQWQCSTNNGFCDIGGFCRSCDRNASCEANGDGRDYACCMGVGVATGDFNNPCQCNLNAACSGDPAPTAVPTPGVSAYVQGRYRLMPSTSTNPQGLSIGETYFGSDANRLKVSLDRYISSGGGDDLVRFTDITTGGLNDLSNTYTSRNLVNDFIINGSPTATWKVKAFVPSGVSVGYTVCYNDTSCHAVPTGRPVPNLGNTVTLNQNSLLNSGNTSANPRYADVYWHYCRNLAPGGLRVSPELGCGQTGAQTVMWDGLNGTVSYQLRIDDGGTWTGDANGDGRCDFQGQNPNRDSSGNPIYDWCVDNIPATVSPSYVIPNGLPAGKTYRIWVHAINQCGGGTTVSTQITYARTCGPTSTPAVSPRVTPTPAPVSCQNITVWKNNVRIYEPYSSIRLNDNISYVATVNSSRSISQIVYSVTKNGIGGRESVPAICPPALNNRNYTGTLTKRQDVYGTYNIRYHSVVYGNCVPNETN